MTLASVDIPVFITNSQVDHSNFGLRMQKVSGKVALTGSNFAFGHNGVDASEIRHIIVSDSELAHFTGTAMYIHNSAVKEVMMSDIVWVDNSNHIRIDVTRDYSFDPGHMIIEGNSVSGGQKALFLAGRDVVWIIANNEFSAVTQQALFLSGRDVVWIITNNEFSAVTQQALFFDGTDSIWNITNNEFHDMSGQIVRVRGTGNFTSNVIQNCTYPGGVLVDIVSGSSDKSSIIKGNTFENNMNVSNILSFCSQSDSGYLLRNTFVNNFIIDSVITCTHSSLSATTQQFVDNIFVDNSATTEINTYSAALTIRWPSVVEAHGNRFANPNLTYEVVNQLPTFKSLISLDFTNNSWGTSDTRVIHSRIYDGIHTGWGPVIQWLSGTSTELSLDATRPLHGRLDKSLTLRQQTDPYLVSGDLRVLGGVTLPLEAGVTLALEHTASLFIEGRLVARGSTERPVQFQRVHNQRKAMPLRLVNGHNLQEGRLEAFVSSTWRPVCSIGWTTSNAHVACRQLGFGKGKWHSLTDIVIAIFECSRYEFFRMHKENEIHNNVFMR